MIERLDQLSLSQFIDLTCGNADVLLEGDEKLERAIIAKKTLDLFRDYKAIASPTRAKMDLYNAEEKVRLKIKERCARICLVLCIRGDYDTVREILAEMDHTETMTDSQVFSRVRAIIDESVFELKRIKEQEEEKYDKKARKSEGTNDTRNAWYSEIAWVMSTLRMSIDPATTNTAIYANLVHQAEVRAKQMAKMPSMFPF